MLASDAELRELLVRARTIAVVGLSDSPARDSYRVARYLQYHGYHIIPVNPNVASVLGVPAVPDLNHLPYSVDIVNIFRRPEHVPAIVEAAIQGGARAVWMQLGVLHTGAAARAAESGLQVVAGRCIMVEHRRLVT